MSDTRAGDEPMDRYTRLAAVAMAAVQADREFRPGDKVLVGIDAETRSGFHADGYDGLADLLVSLMSHARGLLESSRLGTAQISSEGSDLVLRLRIGRDAPQSSDGPLPDPADAADVITAIVMSAISGALAGARKTERSRRRRYTTR